MADGQSNVQQGPSVAKPQQVQKPIQAYPPQQSDLMGKPVRVYLADCPWSNTEDELPIIKGLFKAVQKVGDQWFLVLETKGSVVVNGELVPANNMWTRYVNTNLIMGIENILEPAAIKREQ
jgi:hypothetical protein